LVLGGTSGSSLRDLHGLEHLTELGGLGIVSFDSLTSLDGPPSFPHFTGDIVLSDLDALESIAALTGVRSVDGMITLENLGRVIDLAPLAELTRASV
jgi:hypothetical protein